MRVLRRWLPRAVILLLALASAAQARIQVEFRGNESFRRNTLLDILAEEPRPLTDEEVVIWSEDAAYDVEQFYLERGYFRVRVRAQAFRPDPQRREWTVTLRVSEGPRYRFGNVSVLIDRDPSLPFRLGALEAREGLPYREDAVRLDLRDLQRQFGDAGFMRATVRDSVIFRDSLALADVIYLVTRGEAVVFDSLQINVRRMGNDSLSGLTREDLVRDMVTYRRGDTVRVNRNDRLIRKLRSTGQYISVRLEDTTYADGQTVMKLDLVEKVPGRARTSVFYETLYGFGALANAEHSNVAGTLNEIRAGLLLAQRKQSATLGYGSPITFGLQMRFDNDLFVEWLQANLPDEPPFEGDMRVANVASLSRTLYYWLRLLGGAEIEYRSRLVTDPAGGLSRESGGLANLTATSFVSFLDQALNPARGVRMALTLGNGGPIYERGEVQLLQDRHNWVELQSAYYYYPPGWRAVKGAVRLNTGRFFGAGGQNADRFFLGGPRSVRSYGFRQLCPDAPAPEEGSCPLTEFALEPAYYLASAELRLSPFELGNTPERGARGFLRPLQVVPFTDFGKVWNLRSEDDPAAGFPGSGYGRGVAYGIGIRYPFLGIFNLRVDAAWGRPGGGSLPDAWIIDLAQAF